MADRIAILNRGSVEQLDTPVGLYSRPSSRFVANFIGSANLFDGIAVDGAVEIAGLGLFPVTHSLPMRSDATLVVRPEDVRIVPVGGAGGGATSGSGIVGTVVDTFFLGGSSTVSIEVPGITRSINCTVHAADVARRGDTVAVSFDLPRAVAVANPAPALV